MLKLISGFSFILLISLSHPVCAQEFLRGTVFGITPKDANITPEYCKSHIANTYKGTADQIKTSVKAENGVEIKSVNFSSKQEGGIYLVNGTVELSGNYEGKVWKEKARYYSYALDKTGVQQGIWYTKDCKGFFKIELEQSLF